MVVTRERAKSGKRIGDLESVSVLLNELHLLHMPCHCPGCMRSERVESCSDADRFKSFIFDVSVIQVCPSNILTLTVWALEGSAEMISRSSLFEPYLILNLCQGGSIEVPRYCNFEVVEMMRDKTASTPCSLARVGTSTVVAKIRADNP